MSRVTGTWQGKVVKEWVIFFLVAGSIQDSDAIALVCCATLQLCSIFLGETRIFLSRGIEIGMRIFLKCIEIDKVQYVICHE